MQCRMREDLAKNILFAEHNTNPHFSKKSYFTPLFFLPPLARFFFRLPVRCRYAEEDPVSERVSQDCGRTAS